MPDGGLYVYKCARDAHEQITRLSDFVSPTIVAMWNLRWQVQGFLGAMPRATQEDIVQRFALGSDVRGNEIKRACVDNSWEDQQSRFSSILLTNTIAIFEEFLERLVGATISDDEAKRKAVRALQFPVAKKGKNYLGGYTALGAKLPELVGVFNSGKALGRWYSGTHVQNLLLCYRFFKEIRNVGAHNGGRATQELMDAYAAFLPVATPADLGLKEVPKHAVPVFDQVIRPELRGAYGFSDVVLRLVATYDRDLSDRKGALVEMDRRMKTLPAVKRSHSVELKKRARLIDGLFLEANLPKGNSTPAFLEFLKTTKRIPSHW
jgi:hypothetical protein